MSDNLKLPPVLVAYFEEHGIPVEVCVRPIPRFFRVHPSHTATLEELQSDLKTADVSCVEWLPDFYQCPATVRLSQSPLYQRGVVLGMDAASAVAVYALGIEPGHHVLDLCCAPGAKLALVSHLLDPTGTVPFRGSLTGVDISEPRLAIARAAVRKLGIVNARLFVADGTTFAVQAPLVAEALLVRSKEGGLSPVDRLRADALPTSNDHEPVRVFHASKPLRGDPQLAFADGRGLYDRVLVDAECTHDGSIAHLLKYRRPDGTWPPDSELSHLRLTAAEQTRLETLQRALLTNGWRMLKPGGRLVYSTCSLTERQNERVVRWFLARNPDAKLIKVPVAPAFPRSTSSSSTDGESLWVRMDPIATSTSGMFVALLAKNE
ncbi:S-adenosyl-L-methionine-dependent methyltransferase [Blastocladiella britannica]|nr:S-adenosyl-L-methionine-dependent methyltransferase [Blastocladiella britannica]